MSWRTRLVLVLFLICSWPSLVLPFKYKVDDTLEGEEKITYSERFMWGTDNGPVGARGGSSFIATRLHVHASSMAPANFTMNAVLWRSMSPEYDSMDDIETCGESWGFPADMVHVQTQNFPMDMLQVTAAAGTGESSSSGQQYLYHTDLDVHYSVADSGVYFMLLQLCPAAMLEQPAISVRGSLDFKNPYGYLPGMFYGYLPFEGWHAAACLLFDVFFICFLVKYRSSALRLHFAILGVLVLATLEALSWFVAYAVINKSGTPYCCPFPGAVVFAMTMAVLQKTASRFLLLVVCLGFGVTRLRLERWEALGVGGITLAFLVTGVWDQIDDVRSAKLGATDEAYRTTAAIVPAMLVDMLFLMWIYQALLNMLKNLKDQNETFKLQMYTQLAWTISIFAILFAVLNIILVASQTGAYNWQWEWYWVPTVLSEVLNFTVLAAVCTIWRPSERSELLAFSKQLAASEEQADSGLEMGIVQSFTIGDDEDDEEIVVGLTSPTTSTVRSTTPIRATPLRATPTRVGAITTSPMRQEQSSPKRHGQNSKVVEELAPARNMDMT